ncbi:dirigent protein 11 [Phtheirospermum japonicum]|uniref:Dirigent protein n=1 Tax=Phtheirospermum japonicum TaxID=374723 RepID=A0A830C4J4_9LAMI|nr:dirigent protein 11 [Phtheirospermum japonicum]
MEKLFIFLILCSLFIGATSSTSIVEEAEAQKWIQTFRSQQQNRTPAQPLQFYAHDDLTGPGATVWEVARANITSNSSTSFGQVRVVDDLITVGPERGSNKVGRLQGLITSSDMQEDALSVSISFVFNAGPFNGSTLCIMGRSPILESYRELAVVGGTGVFRMARGYVNGSTYDFGRDGDQINYAIFKYNVYLYH